MQDEEKESENSELFEDCFDEVLHKNSYDFWLFDLISVSLSLSPNMVMIEIVKGWYGKVIIHTSLLTVQNIFDSN